MEEFIAGILRLLLSFVRFILEQWFVEALCFHTGRVIIAVFTFGQYPRSPISEDTRFKISILGLVIIISILLAIGIYNTIAS
jgi:hypothetical protein